MLLTPRAGGLRLDTTPDELPDWDDEKRATHTEHVRKCTERGGVIIGAFDLQPSGHQVLVGCTVLDGEWILEAKDTLDMSAPNPLLASAFPSEASERVAIHVALQVLPLL